MIMALLLGGDEWWWTEIRDLISAGPRSLRLSRDEVLGPMRGKKTENSASRFERATDERAHQGWGARKTK